MAELKFKRILDVYDTEDGTPADEHDFLAILKYHGIGGTWQDGDEIGQFEMCLRGDQLDRLLNITAETPYGQTFAVELIATK